MMYIQNLKTNKNKKKIPRKPAQRHRRDSAKGQIQQITIFLYSGRWGNGLRVLASALVYISLQRTTVQRQRLSAAGA